MALKKSQKSLKRWTKQKWRTPSGKHSGKTGEIMMIVSPSGCWRLRDGYNLEKIVVKE